MAENFDLVSVAKTWIQRPEAMPIDFDELWERAGYTDRSNSARAFEQCVVNFGLVEGKDYSSFKTVNVITRYGKETNGKPRQSWKMTMGAAKRFLASAQTKEGYAVIEALIKAEEELQALKANMLGSIESIVDSRLAAMLPVLIEKVTAGVVANIAPMLHGPSTQPRGLSMRELVAKSRTLVAWHDSIQQDYGYSPVQASRSFGKIIKTAAKHAGAILGVQNGVEVYDESKLLGIVEKAAEPMARFSRRNRNKYKPSKDQLSFDFLNRN